MIKIGRNQPCPCGSGKKYKKCCSVKEKSFATAEGFKVPKEVIDQIQKQIAKQKALENMGIYINYVKPVKYTNPKTKMEHKAWALGNTLFYTRDPNETFHQFIIDRLRQTFGKEWWEKELKLSSEERHFAMKCFLNLNDWQTRDGVEREKITEKIWAAKPDGWTKSLLSLAFDVCSLIHTRHLPDHLLNRLKNQNEYQGARYEIAIAAMFARLGCDIKFLDENEKLTIKHCEFIATHQNTGVSVAVEAKSRHRSGILHTLGIRKEEDLLKGDVKRLLNRALKQNPGDKPFMIFIDINSPITPKIKIEEKQWFQDIKKMIESHNAPTPENPDLHNGIFFTNYSYHYQAKEEAEPGEYLSIIPRYSKFSLPDSNFLIMLDRAIANYGNVPNLDLEYNDNMDKRILILHGWESNSKEHWFLEEKERLEKLGHRVFVPDLPNTKLPRKGEWVRVIEDFDPDDNSVLIGHSLGGTAILRYLEEIDVQIKRCVLIATPIRKLGFEATDNFFEPDFNWEKIKQNCREFFILNQIKDPWVPLEHGESLAGHVNGKLIKIEGNNHFDTIDFSVLEKCILS